MIYANYRSEAFRVFKDCEPRIYREYRTRHQLLEAWDKIDMTTTAEMAKC